MSLARTAYAWAIGVLYTLFWATLGIVTWPLSPRGELYLKYARIWSAWILASLRIPLTIERRAPLDPHASYLFMSNHRSIFDIFALFLATEHSLRMVAKRELFYIPILGWSLWMCGFIPIDRSNRPQAIESLNEAARRIRAGTSVLVFPEGTRNPGGVGLQSFKKGGFMMALQAAAPIVPVAVLGSEWIMPKGALTVGRGSITVRVGAPIVTAGRDAEKRDLLIAEVRTAMEDLLADPVAAEKRGP